ncbi:MAG: ParB/RepB/Spo0J family partition protein [Acidobacteriota bacterium]|nr:ParB/RepB/Spo0J family partition protein [Acidobacteriota bacterium]
MVKRKGLGRGLGALIKEESATTASTVALKKLKPNRLQPRDRFDSPALAELAASIRAQGLVQPIVVTPTGNGDYTIIAGERRWRAARQVGLEEVPVSIRRVKDDRELLEMALVENLQRTDLNPVEEARAYRRLADDFGLRQEDIAQRVGKSRAVVSNTARLLGLPEEVLEYLREGQLTAGQARPLLALSDPDEQIRLARQAVKIGLSARDLERTARRKRRKSEPEANTLAAAEQLTRRLGTKVEIRRRGKKTGSVVISFHSEEELIRLHEILMKAGGLK